MLISNEPSIKLEEHDTEAFVSEGARCERGKSRERRHNQKDDYGISKSNPPYSKMQCRWCKEDEHLAKDCKKLIGYEKKNKKYDDGNKSNESDEELIVV